MANKAASNHNHNSTYYTQSQVNNLVNGCVKTSGNQNVSGTKNFANAPTVLYNGVYCPIVYGRNQGNRISLGWAGGYLEIWVDTTRVARIPQNFAG